MSSYVKDDDPIAKLLNPKADDDEIPCKLVRPSPGFCVKTHTLEGDKIFMNICYTDGIPEPEDLSDAELIEILESDEPSAFRVPMSIGNLHSEVDRRGNLCSVYDIAINTQFFSKVYTNQLFQTFFITVVMEGLMEKYSLELTLKDPKPYHIVKNRKCLGTLQSHRIQQRPVKKNVPLIQELPYVSPYTKIDPKNDNLPVIKPKTQIEPKNERLVINHQKPIEPKNCPPKPPEVPESLETSLKLKTTQKYAPEAKKDNKKKPLIEEITPEEYSRLTSNIKINKSNTLKEFSAQTSLDSLSELPDKLKNLDSEVFQSSENPLAVNDTNRIRIFGLPNNENPKSIIAFIKLNATSCQDLALNVGEDHILISNEQKEELVSFGLPVKINIGSAQAVYSVNLQVLKLTLQTTEHDV